MFEPALIEHLLTKFVENIVWVYTYFQPFDVREPDSHLQKTQMFNEFNPFIFLLSSACRVISLCWMMLVFKPQIIHSTDIIKISLTHTPTIS